MKHHFCATVIASLGLAASAVQAGTTPDKNPAPKNPPPPIEVESICDCFDEGKVTVSLYGAGIVFDDIGDDALGGGLGIGYFFTEYTGVEVDATWLATDSVLHNFSGSLVLRYPIKSACLAPYLIVGGGYETDSVQQWTAHVGGGIDWRFGSGPTCPGLFVDARYTWTEEDVNFTLIRAGFKFNL
ncbi:MAG: outer membrane beta-barrel protein [Verrucomicrobiales bacterium]